MSISYKDYNEKYRTPEQEFSEQLLLKRKHFILGFEPGKGKSYPVIHAIMEIQRLKEKPISVLILSNARCIKDMWKAEIETQYILPKDTYYVTDRTAIGNVKEALLRKHWDVIVCDECQSLRSGVTRAKTKYAKLVHALTKKTEYVFGMTGTLSGNNYIEPWCVIHNLNIAGMGEISTNTFRYKFCVLELQYGPFGSFQKPTQLNESGQALMEAVYDRGVMFWGYDDDDTSMPPFEKDYKVFKVPKTREYENALEGILKLNDNESTVIKAAAIQKAQQALNGFMYYNDENGRQVYYIKDYVNPKIEYVLERAKSMSKCLIVAYRFQEDYVLLNKALVEAGIENVMTVQEFKQLLSQGKKCVLLLQCSKGNSVNIQECQDIIYYTCDFSFINFKQMMHRCWRRDQKEKCSIMFLINDVDDNEKVEYRIWSSLQTKQNIHNLLMSIKQGGAL